MASYQSEKDKISCLEMGEEKQKKDLELKNK